MHNNEAVYGNPRMQKEGSKIDDAMAKECGRCRNLASSENALTITPSPVYVQLCPAGTKPNKKSKMLG